MTKAQSRRAKIAKHTARFERFIYEMDNMKAILAEVQKYRSGESSEFPINIRDLDRRTEHFNFMVDQITNDAHKWALQMRKDMRLLEEIVGECELRYFWIFEGCGIEWETDRYWQGCKDEVTED